MNDKMFTIAMFLTFLIIGINGFLLMAGELQDANGNQVQIFYDLSGNALQQTQSDLTFELDTTASSSSPNTATGFVPAKDNAGDPFGISKAMYVLGGMLGGVQLTLMQIDAMFTPNGATTSPFYGIIWAIIVFVSVIQAMGLGYLTATMIRIFLGRQV